MGTEPASKLSAPWEETQRKLLQKTEDALVYLDVTQAEAPELMKNAIKDVLAVHPDLISAINLHYKNNI